MRILQVHKFFFPHRGAERYYFDLSDLLTQHGHEVIPFAMADVRNLPSPYQDYFSRHIDVSRPRWSFDSLRLVPILFNNRNAAADIARLIQATKPQLVHIHNIYHHLSPSILAVCKYYKLPVIMTIHDFFLLCPNYDLFLRGKVYEHCRPKAYWHCIADRCVKNSFGASIVGTFEAYLNAWSGAYQQHIDAFIAPSRFVKQKFAEWQYEGVDRMAVIPHFLPTPAKAPRPTIGEYLLFVGSLVSGKGVTAILETLASERFDIPFHIVGDGPERQMLEQLVDRLGLRWQVTFHGRLVGEELAAVMHRSRLVIIPSLQYETFGLTVLEAFAAGKPVLVSAQGALPELVDNTVGGVFHHGQKGSLGRALRQLWYHSNLPSLGAAGYRRLLEQYNGEKHYQQLLALYQHLVEQPKVSS